MSDETLEAYIRQLIDGRQFPRVTVAWQRGDPTLMGTANRSQDWRRGLCERLRRRGRRR
jgi:sulfatase maturation enzyme AslB (radical SAM superfamily)